ncbi:MAG: PorT family protein [Bacteroidales bacterium]|jgi:hypothetical protein|nr:PorT family protein [Bacteroidales bacterium]
MKKKSAITLLLIICLTGAYAQNENNRSVKTTWGLKAEMNLSGFIVSGTSVVTSDMKLGGSGGGFVNFEFTNHWALRGELLFHYRASGMEIQWMTNEFQYWGVQIPMYAVYQWNFNRGGRVYAGLGPYAEFGFSARLKREGEKMDLYEKDGATEISAMKDSDIGFGMMVGYEFANGIQINASYKIGVANILDANSSIFKMMPHAASLGLGYRFGK